MTDVIQENIALKRFTTLGIGGPARFFAEARTEEAVLGLLAWARKNSIPLVVLGGGSNLLVADSGFPGLVLHVAIGGTRIMEAGDRTLIQAGAGVQWDRLVAECVTRDLFGVECLSGIPGSVGATPIQNVGAYGQEVSDVITSVRVYDRDDSCTREIPARDCDFSYRRSLFNTTARHRHIVLGVTYALKREGHSPLDYPDLEHFFRGRSAHPGLMEVREAVRSIRAAKAMLLIQDDPDSSSAGSFFKNPIVSEAGYRDIEAAAKRHSVLEPGESVPRFPAPSGEVKVPAAWLIERAGFRKGTSDGAVGLSTKHALALINRGGARAEDVLSFAGKLQEGVAERFGVRLSAEPAFLGFRDEVVKRFGAVRA